SDLPTVSPGKHYLLAPLRFSGAFHPRAEPRRSCPWETLLALKNARRRVAEIRQSSDVLWVDVWASGEKASLYGRRVRAMAGMESRRLAGLGAFAVAPARWSAPAGSTLKLSLQERT